MMNYPKPQSANISLEQTVPLPKLPLDTTLKSISSERILKLVLALHSSLNLKTIIQQFFQGIQAEVPCDNIGYSNESIYISIHIGKTEHHQLRYTLDPQHNSLRIIKLSRNHPFRHHEIHQLDNCLCFLLNP